MQHDLLTGVNTAQALFLLFQQCSTSRNRRKSLILLCFLGLFMYMFSCSLNIYTPTQPRNTLYKVKWLNGVRS